MSAFFDFLAANGDPSDFWIAQKVITEIPGVEHFLADAAARHPQLTLPRTLLASRHVIIGWDVRGSGWAKDVSKEQFRIFHDQLRQAERLLIKITAAEPANTLAWTLRLITARALSLGQGEARRRYQQLARYDPHHFGGQTQMLEQLCPKWGGDWEAMQSFARDCAKDAPPGSRSALLIVEAYLELWTARGTEYLQRQLNLRNELIEAAERSVLHPAFRSRYGWVSGHNSLAALFGLIGDHQRAALHFQRVGDFVSEYPWSYFGDPVESFVMYRTLALGRG
jgi:hypothetical protein